MSEIDYLGAEGGRLATAFAAGVLFITPLLLVAGKFIWAIVGKSYETRIAALEAENERCETRVIQLETMLWMHGPQQLRNDLQAAVSEQHIELRREIENRRLEGGSNGKT